MKDTYWSVDPFMRNGDSKNVAAERAMIKSAGFKIYPKFKTEQEAIEYQQEIENATGIKCEVFSGTFV